jgi:hypothetical protein
MSKAHATVDECLLLVRLKRENAKAAMKQIVVEFGLPTHRVPFGLPTHRAPDILTILEYLTNMVYCIEMMLKMLSGDWGSHKVGKMYETVFGKPHANQVLMDEITIALRDQRYLFEPNGGLLAQIADLEELYDDLKGKICEIHPTFDISRAIPAPPAFLTYLRDNITRFHTKKGPTVMVQRAALADLNAVGCRDAPMEERRTEIQEIQSFFDLWVREGRTFEFFHEETSLT